MPAVSDPRSELVRLARQIQELKLELDEVRTKAGASSALEPMERALDQLRWRLAVIARRVATNHLDDAA